MKYYSVLIQMIKQIWSASLLVMSILFSAQFALAAVTRTASDFNHLQTGFALSGAHLKLECETCHVGGVFKGTPKACDGCHAPGRRVVATIKPSSHVMTNQPCDACHTNTVTFSGIRFNHVGVQPKTCANCHNGITGPGKPSGHLATTSQCDSCHRNTTWIPAGFDHVSANPPVIGRCSDCHNNVKALGKPAWHVTTALQCDSAGCHTNTKNYTTFAGLKYDHSVAVPGQCGTCHSGQVPGAPTQTPGHIPYSGNGCDNCHKSPAVSPGATFAAPVPIMNHGAVAALTCSKCHTGSYVSQKGSLGLGPLGKPGNHINTTSECNHCHYDASYTSFLNAVMNHAAQNPAVNGRCNDCHLTGTGGAKQKSAVHIPTTNQCDACHSGYVTFPGTGATMNHAIEGGQACTACHNGSYTTQGSKYGGAKAMTSIGNHIPVTNTDCKICHTGFTSFTTPLSSSTILHTAVSTVCKTCHDSSANYRGNMTKMPLSHKTEALKPGEILTDCSQSSCHKPAGIYGTSYIRWTN